MGDEVPEQETKQLKAVIAGGSGATGRYLLTNILKTKVGTTVESFYEWW